ncbi:MAG: PD-(D/E)XK nuclease domain-containing protein [Saprospiraceae bacterium]
MLGRIDLVISTGTFLYIMEFKMDGSAQEALAQIKEKDYTAPFANTAQKVFLVGIHFSNEERNWEDWVVEEG